jgi:DNA-binding CsgD family transcriptional regulator/tetratricopeptide (TPR) repeat protein
VSFPSSANSTPLLVGRERELGVLRQQLEMALAGQGSLVLIGGEAGIGKTALAEGLCQEAAAQDALVLVGRSYDLTETPPYGPWVEVFDRLRQLEAIPFLPAAFSRRGTVDAVDSQAALLQQVEDFVRVLASQRPLILLLEDVHWADPASLDLLRFLARRLHDMRLLAIVTYRSEEVAQQHPLAPLLPLLVREARAARLDLRPLSEAAVRTLVADHYHLADTDASRLAGYLRDRGEGNPLFIGELLRALEETEVLRHAGDRWTLGPLAAIQVPPLLRQVIGGRVSRLDGERQRLLGMAAIIGQEVPYALWATAAGVDEEHLLEVITAAEAAHLMVEQPDGSGASFTHALVREALYEDARPSQRRRWHQRVGEALAALPHADPDAVAHHFQRAGDTRAVAWLLRATDRAQRAYAWLTAADRLDAALALTEADGSTSAERAWLLFRLAGLRTLEGGGHVIPLLDEAIRAAVAGEDRALAAYALCLRGFQQFWAGERRRGLTEMEAGVEALDALPDTERERLAKTLASGTYTDIDDPHGTFALHLAHVGRFAEAEARAAPLLDEAEHIGGADQQGDTSYRHLDVYTALLHINAFLGRPAEAQRAAQRARAALEAVENHWFTGLVAFRELALVILPYRTDALAEREAVAEVTAAAWQRAGGAQPRTLSQGARVDLLFLEGEWDEIGPVVDAVLATYAWATVQYRPTVGRLLLARGETEKAWALVRAELPDGAGTAPGANIFREGFAAHQLAAALALDAGELETAKQWLDAADSWLDWSGSVLGMPEQQILWARYHRQVDDRGQAYACAERALALATEPRQPLALLAAHRLLGELDTEAGQYDDATTRLDESLRLADACRAPYERALTLLAMAEMHARRGERGEAERLLDAVRAICAPLAARPTLARADALASRLTVTQSPPPAYPAGLSAREVEVLRLVAAGRTNREIADTLFVSLGTINNHLVHILTKTDCANRAEATAFALRNGLV